MKNASMQHSSGLNKQLQIGLSVNTAIKVITFNCATQEHNTRTNIWYMLAQEGKINMHHLHEAMQYRKTP